MKILIPLCIIALFVVGGGWLIWRDVQNAQTQTAVVATSTAIDMADAPAVTQGALEEGAIEVVLTENKELEARALALVAGQIVVKAAVPEPILADMKQQIRDITASIKKNYDNLESWLRLGALRKGLDDFEGARDAWEFAGILRPYNAISFQNLGYLYTNFLADYVLAEKNYRKAIEHSPEFIDAYLNLADLYQYHLTDRKAETARLLLRGIEANGDMNKRIALISRLASYYKEAGDVANAIKYLEQVAEFMPQDQGVRDELAKLKAARS